jgi:hypothetical protein
MSKLYRSKGFGVNTLLLASLCVTSVLGQNWWDASLGRHVNTEEEFNQLMTGELVDKLVIGEFYMQKCPYCVALQPTWN